MKYVLELEYHEPDKLWYALSPNKEKLGRVSMALHNNLLESLKLFAHRMQYHPELYPEFVVDGLVFKRD